MTVKSHDAPWGLVVSLVPKSVADYFHEVSHIGEAGIPIPPAEQAVMKAQLQAIHAWADSMDISKYGVTGYELFRPAFEEHAVVYDFDSPDENMVNIAKMVRDFQAGLASGTFTHEYERSGAELATFVRNGRGDGTDPAEIDYTLWNATATVCDILIVNGLDDPLTAADPDIGHGYPIYFPEVRTPIDHGDPVVASTNIIPGRTCMPDGTNRFGLGLFRFQKGQGAAHGTEGAMQLTTSDPAAPQPIGIAWGLDYHNTPSAAVTADLSQYNSLDDFYLATTGVSKSINKEDKFGVSITCFIDYTSSQAPGKQDGHRVVTVVIQPTDGVRETNADLVVAAASPLPAILKNLAAALPAPQAAPAPPFIGTVEKHDLGGGTHLPPHVVPFNSDDN